jgi:hypothetical protein
MRRASTRPPSDGALEPTRDHNKRPRAGKARSTLTGLTPMPAFGAGPRSQSFAYYDRDRGENVRNPPPMLRAVALSCETGTFFAAKMRRLGSVSATIPPQNFRPLSLGRNRQRFRQCYLTEFIGGAATCSLLVHVTSTHCIATKIGRRPLPEPCGDIAHRI